MLHMLSEMVKVRKNDIFVALWNMEKTHYDKSEKEETV